MPLQPIIIQSNKKLLWLILSLFISNQSISQNINIQQFGKVFWEWRSQHQPSASDDIPRIERPVGWVPDFSPTALSGIQSSYENFKQRLTNLPKAGWSRSDSVDYLILRSAVERVNWELNVLKLPYRNPDFYVQQTLGSVYELLLIHTPIDNARITEIIRRLNSIPATITHAKINLTDPFSGGGIIAIQNLEDINAKLQLVKKALEKQVPKIHHAPLAKSIDQAARSLEDYRNWLTQKLPSMNPRFEVGRDHYKYFLKNIALMPYEPEEILLLGTQEWTRSVAFDAFEKNKNVPLPTLTMFKDTDEQIAKEKSDEQAIRDFLEQKNIMTVPPGVNHYLNKKFPDHIIPLRHIGMTDDLTSESRSKEDGVAYIPEPGPNLPYFYRAIAQDPRPIIVHEGVPGHYFQLVRSWSNPNPLRRRYVDSGANEGIGFYVEEMLLQQGLFDDKPRTREIIYSFMRLRALRVDVDVNLALGNYTIKNAAHYLETIVPMDKQTATEEAGSFALTPGQAISYQIGKIQIIKFLADARIQQGEQFDLRKFHDSLMINGNVPISLQRYEYLGLTDELKKIWPN